MVRSLATNAALRHLSDMPQIGMPGWFNRHHESVSQELDEIKAQNVLILQAMERLITMSATLETDLAAQSAAVQALASEVTAGLAANAAAIQALKDQIAAGTPVTAADLATLEGNTAAVQAATEALTAALNPPAPPPAP